LNSVYGFTGTQFSPVFSQDIAEAVTLTGQATTKEMVRYTNAALNKLGGTDLSTSHVVAGDTDSVFSDAKIYVNNNLKTIKDTFNEFINDGKLEILQNGTEVIVPNKKFETKSINGLTYIKNISRHKVSKGQYKISINEQQTLNITEDHSIMIYRNGEIIECKPNEIKNTDYLIVL
jgi:DNA polymerase elongation subunit (family B)